MPRMLHGGPIPTALPLASSPTLWGAEAARLAHERTCNSRALLLLVPLVPAILWCGQHLLPAEGGRSHWGRWALLYPLAAFASGLIVAGVESRLYAGYLRGFRPTAPDATGTGARTAIE